MPTDAATTLIRALAQHPRAPAPRIPDVERPPRPGPADRSLPRERTPVFYGSYDWHSNVHSTWALVWP